ncbi:hypothetical protein NP233_g5327 [Leucocoprinus birnbaumii]|uniref:Stress response protein NST1 n=1 Tax=Leucocoprinus birnbaumii TaxID=56174 RepID=A0AAD5YWU6_9AGAR|nr:hypothetical protein NP233_g5327 [Leucocoprinus birnbaumii]
MGRDELFAMKQGYPDTTRIGTSLPKETERIKAFWLGLSEKERKNLVIIEKNAVIGKMKEQQKHSCQAAIEEELEVLYDAYYNGLEQYTNDEERHAISNDSVLSFPESSFPPGNIRTYQEDPIALAISPSDINNKDVECQLHEHTHSPHPLQPNHDVVVTELESEHEIILERQGQDYKHKDGQSVEEEEEDCCDESVTDGRQSSKPETYATRTDITTRKGKIRRQPDPFLPSSENFIVSGPGNILTVADDMLRGDGQKFLEMMEQLAERRMQREVEALGDLDADSSSTEEDSIVDEGEGIDEGDADSDSETSDTSDSEVVSDEQKAKEGKRMFSLFATRMFEQRIIQGIREQDRTIQKQIQLLKDLESRYSRWESNRK